jgi:hypothetical protein
MEYVDEFESPPLLGTTYLVPCAVGSIPDLDNLDAEPIKFSFPVLLPSHEDSKYNPLNKSGTSVLGTPHHFHLDARFTPMEYYAIGTRNRIICDGDANFHSTLFANEYEHKEMVCLREMPESLIKFRVFGKLFLEDHKGKSMKCGRCPHKGIDLRSMPRRNGIITCPGHALKFDAETGCNVSIPQESGT